MLETAQNVLMCKNLLDNFPDNMTPEILKPIINPPFVFWLCNHVQKIFKGEPNVIETASPVIVVGDIHGQFDDLITVFKLGGLPIHQRYIFLGDYIDRGPNSLEVIFLLFMLKLTYPMHLILLRGNHESRSMATTYGFSAECEQKLTTECVEYFCSAFDTMPLCAIVDNKAFCVHAGISQDLHSINDIQNIDRFQEVPESGLFCDLLWSDPSRDCKEWRKSDRCDTCVWGLEPAHKFLYNNNLSMIIRGHQVAEEGYEYEFFPNKSVVTVFSAKSSKNKAVFMKIDRGMHIEFTDMHSLLSQFIISHKKPITKRKSKSQNSRPIKNNNFV